MAIEISKGWFPMPPNMGPPLPQSMELYWPWYKPPEVPPEVTYACPYCVAEFATESELYDHISTAHPAQPPKVIYMCPHCGAKFDTMSELTSHITSIHPPAKVYTCPHCGAQFSTEAEINYHIQIAHPEVPPEEIPPEEVPPEEIIPPVPPLTFSNVSVRDIVCPKATAYWIPIFDCTIRNQTDQAITHTLSLRHKRYSHTYNRWDYKYAATIETFERTLVPGQSYSYHYESPPDRCYPSIFAHYTDYFWLEDELGNKSIEVNVYRP